MSKYIYQDDNTFFHRLDPRTKMLFTFAHYLVVTLWVSQIWLMLAVFAELVVLTFLTKSWNNLKKLLFIIVIIFVTGIIMWSLSSRGKTTLIGPITLEPILMGVASGLRSAVGIFVSIILLTTTRNEEISQGLIKIGLPYRVGFAFSTALRMAPTLMGTTSTVVDAQKSRGLDMEKGGLFERIRKFVPLVVPAFLITMRSTEQMAMAIESRGFGYQEKRSFYMKLAYAKWDYAWIAFSLLLMVAAIIISILKWGVVFSL